MEEILWVFLTFMKVFPIPPLSRGRSGGGWGIYVAVVLRHLKIEPIPIDFNFDGLVKSPTTCHCEESRASRDDEAIP